MINKCYDISSLKEIADSLLSDSATLHDLYAANIPMVTLKENVLEFLPMVQYFIEKYLDGKNPPLPNAKVLTSRQQGNNRHKYSDASQAWEGRIDSICDIEENMWSPWLGVKGKVDFTLKVKRFLICNHCNILNNTKLYLPAGA